MSQSQLFYPMFAMAVLPALVMLRAIYTRACAINNGEMKFHFLEKGSPAPMAVITSTHNLANLFEFPALFFVALLAMMAMNQNDTLIAQLSWFYVATRYLHSLVHLTSNHALSRFTVFAVSNFILIIIWLRLFMIVFTAKTA